MSDGPTRDHEEPESTSQIRLRVPRYGVDRSRQFGGSCSTGHATVTLQLAPLAHSGEKTEALYLAWLAREALAIDFQKPPSQGVVVRPDRSTIQLGISHLCSRGWDWRPERDQTELRIGLIAYDETDNANPPSSIACN